MTKPLSVSSWILGTKLLYEATEYRDLGTLIPTRKIILDTAVTVLPRKLGLCHFQLYVNITYNLTKKRAVVYRSALTDRFKCDSSL